MIIVRRRFSGCWFAIEIDQVLWNRSNHEEKQRSLRNYCREQDIDQVISIFNANPTCRQEVCYRD